MARLPDHSILPRTIEILLVDDDDDDVRLTMRALLRTDEIQLRVHRSSDGIEAMQFLRQTGVHARAPRPNLILLDLNMPRMDGWEVLKTIKGDSDLRTIPVVMLTTSENPQDVSDCRQSGADYFISKPVNLSAFRQSLSSIERFW